LGPYPLVDPVWIPKTLILLLLKNVLDRSPSKLMGSCFGWFLAQVYWYSLKKPSIKYGDVPLDRVWFFTSLS